MLGRGVEEVEEVEGAGMEECASRCVGRRHEDHRGEVSESGIGFEWQKSFSSDISAPRASDGVTPSFRRSESERANWRSKRAS